MDRVIIYPGAVPLETDLLSAERFVMTAIAKTHAAMFGTASAMVNGLSTVPTIAASLNVWVNPGEIYSLQNLDTAAFSSLAADTTHQIVKQGILLDQATLSCPAPVTGGFSINYLIEAQYQDVDGTPIVLPYYNASNPATAYSGPANAGTTNNTTRKGTVSLIAKAGTAATTGTQTTPAPDSGYTGLYVVTVANGQATITAPNIVLYSAAPVLSGPITNGRLINTQVFSAAGAFTYTPTFGTNSIIVEVQGGGGAGGGAPATAAAQVSLGSGGGAGAYARSRIISAFSGVTVTVGAGGTGNSGAVGNVGGTSSFGALVSAPGGSAGQLQAPAAAGFTISGNSSIATGGTIENESGKGSEMAIAISATAGLVGHAGMSKFGPGATSTGLGGTNGSVAVSAGSGGGGTGNLASLPAVTGGAGKSGIVVVWEYA